MKDFVHLRELNIYFLIRYGFKISPRSVGLDHAATLTDYKMTRRLKRLAAECGAEMILVIDHESNMAKIWISVYSEEDLNDFRLAGYFDLSANL